MEEKALTYIARAADGSMRDALSLLDQCVAFHYGKLLTYENVLDVLGAVDTSVFGKIFRAVAEKDTRGCIYSWRSCDAGKGAGAVCQRFQSGI